MRYIVLLLSVSLSHACFQRAPRTLGEQIIEAQWNEIDVKRNVKENCECGSHRGQSSPPWNLYIHIRKGPKANVICEGTIVTSNLVATSHKCFVYPEKRLNFYDLWKPKGGKQNAVYDAGDLIVTTSKVLGQGATFTVEDIIYNPQYAAKSSGKANPPEFDIALLKVKADFTAPGSQLRPICLPLQKDFKSSKALVNTEAFYYGVTKNGSDNNSLSIFTGVIKEEDNSECKQLNNSPDIDKNFCLRFIALVPIPTLEGGPLYVKSGSISFLVGIASNVRRIYTSDGVDFNLFTNIMPLIKYIEIQADTHKSSWCKSPNPFQINTVGRIKKDDGTHRDPWPWESPQNLVPRSEVLDCECGILNSPMGRVVGGEEASPYEYGWMTLLNLYGQTASGGRGSGYLCGGAIINDRMILTAAHCVNEPSSPYREILAKDTDVNVHVHSRRGDAKKELYKVESILFHPDFKPAQNANPRYFDYDVAILILKDRLSFASGKSHGIRPICLPKEGAPYENIVGKTAIVSGWGLTDPTSSSSAASQLQKINLPIAPLKLCSDLALSKVTDRNICAGTLDRYHDAAGGDSGGPLMVARNDKYTQYGIVSWGEDVQKSNTIKTAALYTDLQRVLPFVDFHAGRAKAQWCKPS